MHPIFHFFLKNLRWRPHWWYMLDGHRTVGVHLGWGFFILNVIFINNLQFSFVLNEHSCASVVSGERKRKLLAISPPFTLYL